ncbi:MAG: family 78 glycoside hydrolase catalytic domain [Bacteroidales bacterium]|nr:family 78 glycoside hydrolase catalytic domain [Bacteroidales bacterium]
MKRFERLVAFCGLLLALSACSEAVRIENMRCENVDSPLAVDVPSPRLSWSYSGQDDFVQAGFLVSVAGSEDKLAEADVWSSGEVEGNLPFAVVPESVALSSFGTYFWQVKAWNADRSRILTSPVARFETAMMHPSDWQAQWISDGKGRDEDASPMLRKFFSLQQCPVKARLYISAAAYAEAFINGKRIGEDYLNPGYTHYDKRNLYSVYDVTDLLQKGDNVLAAVLGNGFYNEIRPVATWNFEKAGWRGRARMIAQLWMTMADGSVQTLVSDGSWKALENGPYLSNNIYSGDIYDARKEIPGWNTPAFDDSQAASAVVVNAPSPLLKAQLMPAIRCEKVINAVSYRSFGDSVYVYDFGKNIAGLTELTVRGEAGTRVELAHTELVKDNGRVEPGNINIYFYPQTGYEIQTDIYYLKGGAEETWMPSFCYHGFRYVEVRVDKALKLDINSLKAHYIHTDLQDVATFTCSEPLARTIWEMTRRTYKNNIHSIVTDCPTREKNGWTADNFLSCEMALLNYDGAAFYEKWVDDVVDNIRPDGRISGIIPSFGWGYEDWIGPVWDAAIFLIPSTLYQYTGDARALRKLWPVYLRYLDYLKTREGKDGLPTYGIGDWVWYKVSTPTEFTTPCFYYADYCCMARFARILGEDPAPWEAKAEAIRKAIVDKWYHFDTHLYANGSQAAQGVALYFGLVPEGEEQAVADNLARSIQENDGYLEFGSMGSKTVLRMLTRYGHLDTAWGMTVKRACPSWGWWVEQGFTTLAETWALDPNFRDASIDHVFLGDVSAWYVNDVVGLNADPDKPGWQSALICPHFPQGVSEASASYKSQHGLWRCVWKVEGEKKIVDISVPTNCTATFVCDGVQSRYPAGNHRIIL